MVVTWRPTVHAWRHPSRYIYGHRIKIIRRHNQCIVAIEIGHSAIASAFAICRPHMLANNGFYCPSPSIAVAIVLKPDSVPDLHRRSPEGKVHLPVGLTIAQSSNRPIGMAHTMTTSTIIHFYIPVGCLNCFAQGAVAIQGKIIFGCSYTDSRAKYGWRHCCKRARVGTGQSTVC